MKIVAHKSNQQREANMPTTELMKASFTVREVGLDHMPIIEIEPEGKRLSVLMTDNDTLYLALQQDVTIDDAHSIATYLRNNVTGVSLLRYP